MNIHQQQVKKENNEDEQEPMYKRPRTVEPNFSPIIPKPIYLSQMNHGTGKHFDVV